MNQRTALATAAALTAFVLAVAGSLMAYIDQGAAQPQSGQAPLAQPASAQAQGSADLQTLLNQREASYQQQLDQANKEIQQANQQLKDAYDKIQAMSTPQAQQNNTGQRQTQNTQQTQAQDSQAQQAPQQAQSYPVSMRQAAFIALSAEPGTALVQVPRLVNYNGKTAYEVQLSSGAVYVDANSGAVLYDAAGSSNNSSAPSSGSQPGGDDEGSQGGD